MELFKQLEKKLVISCQALEHEPLHSPFIMGRMAIAAQEAGASGIRANSVADIKEIKQQVDLPIIGLIKQDYADSEVFITPTIKEVKALMAIEPNIIAMDGTDRKRPNDEKLAEIVNYVKENKQHIALMADVSTIEEAIQAEQLGFDCVSTTLIGYTKETKGSNLADNDFAVLKKIKEAVSIPVIAEGRVDTPEKAARVLEVGADFAVVGSAITRPQLIGKTFVDAINKRF
ncbi:N-acetylmannosamine-6-phosphate 2-epimerase [Gracilibacillus salinarum]|uniref:Putative N-acetylmannosamine-6-phosphate 2-epimerase n=1 Tax=Gracilibacillus salinarum TaxID=2932255 RepID=A0ABY4GGU2_9BACI|nr:N-acetylmannosamine-6-phosphate 2-epimerase [Gracilibacillus salinarum]UOQ83472.1 N-acetylmannosamine-6-phosphate 2-epimerase [Gracilibacillus salinarum]